MKTTMPAPEEIVLTFQHFHTQRALPCNLEMKVHYDFYFDSMVTTLRQYVLGRHREITVAMPDGWIEAIKDRWLPQRLRKFFPVRYRDLEAEVFAAYPELHINPMQRHKDGRVMVYHTKVREAYDQ
jgi:hypothetical protein